MSTSSNITVRAGGIISNTLTEEKFLGIAKQLYGNEKSLIEYIKLYNADPKSIKACLAVQKEFVEGE